VDGSTVPQLDHAGIEALVAGGAATAGMIAKLRACDEAIAAGVGDVVIFDGRDGSAIDAVVAGGAPAAATRITGLKACPTGTGA
jgi:acetylglutamate kinase